MQTELAQQIARQLMNSYGLGSWTFRFNNSKRMLGICKSGDQSIELSRAYVFKNDESHVRDTILHEIAHALVGAEHGHDEVWKEMCVRLGCNPKACDNTALLPAGAWQARCANCLTLFSRHRKPAYVSGMYCKRCGPTKGKLLFQKVRKSTFKPVAPAKGGRLKAPRQLTLPLPDVY
ncbi:MAG: SprT-like domain-containing protein [Candidatus Obscuribacterales bacterium]|nr:SprT-like domain-containing protein [Candidatus Obscuribacterales bacterium]